MGIASLQLLFPEGRADYVLKTHPLLLLNLQTCWRRLALNKISTLSLVPSPEGEYTTDIYNRSLQQNLLCLSWAFMPRQHVLPPLCYMEI